jgi:hypothetical protein
MNEKDIQQQTMGTSQEELVRKAEALVSQLKESKQWNKEVGRTQASKAIEVAQEAETLRLFVNWLRYQAARESNRQPFWSASLARTTLAEVLSQELNAIQNAESDDPMPKVRLFLGYFRRALIGADFLDRIKLEG